MKRIATTEYQDVLLEVSPDVADALFEFAEAFHIDVSGGYASEHRFAEYLRAFAKAVRTDGSWESWYLRLDVKKDTNITITPIQKRY